ncbi:unnamed protein product [Camellia sinensis]
MKHNSYYNTLIILTNTNGNNLEKAAAGGLIRDDRGRWIAGFSKNIGVTSSSSVAAELWAMSDGLKKH